MLPSHHPYLFLIICVWYTSPAATKDVQPDKKMLETVTGDDFDVPEITTITPVPIPSDFVIYKTLKKCAAGCTDNNPTKKPAARQEYNFCVMVNLGQFVCCNYTIQICETYAKNEKDFRGRLESNLVSSHHPCNPNKCRHGGTCVELLKIEDGALKAFYDCQCPEGFTGIRCELTDLVETYQKAKTKCREDAGKGVMRRQTCYYGECVTPLSLTGDSVDPFDIIPRTAPWNRMVITEGRKIEYGKSLHFLYLYRDNRVCLCYPGYRGVDCNRDCKPGTWGFYCLHKCDPHCRDGRCDDETGKCDCSDGYVVDEETASCLPDLQPGQCKKLCEDFGRGECDGEYCNCNEEGTGGFYCENSCSNFTRPRYGRKCGMPCGACTIQPCDPKSGECLMPSNNEARCLRMFVGEQCIRYIDGALTAELKVQYQLYWEAYDDGWKYTRDMEQLFNSVESRETLINDLNLGFYSRTGELEIVFRDFRLQLDDDERKKRRRARDQSARKLLQTDAPRLGVSFVASAPALYYNASKLERVVEEGVLTMSRTFRTSLAPGLRIDKNSIKVSKARMVRTSSKKDEDGTEGVSIILYGVMIGLVGLMAVCIASVCFIIKRTKTTARSRSAKISRRRTIK